MRRGGRGHHRPDGQRPRGSSEFEDCIPASDVQLASWKSLACLWSRGTRGPSQVFQANTTPESTPPVTSRHEPQPPSPGLQPHRRGTTLAWPVRSSNWVDSIFKRPATGPTIRSPPNHLGRRPVAAVPHIHLSISPSGAPPPNEAVMRLAAVAERCCIVVAWSIGFASPRHHLTPSGICAGYGLTRLQPLARRLGFLAVPLLWTRDGRQPPSWPEVLGESKWLAS